MKQRRKWSIGAVIAHLIAFLLAMGVAAFFYGFMVYQAIPSEEESQGRSLGTEISQMLPVKPDTAKTDVPHIVLSSGTFVEERRSEGLVRDQVCVQILDQYTMSDGRTVQTVTAWPQNYLEGFLGSEWKPQRITGFSIGPVPASFYLSESGSMLVARDGQYVYLIRISGYDPDGQTAYAIGVTSTIEGREADDAQAQTES